MSKKLYEELNIQGIASAIREKNGTQNTYTTGQMAEAVRAIRTSPSLEELNVVTNGDYVPSSGKDGFSSVHVDVPTGGADPILQEKTATQNGIILPDTGYDGLSKVTVNVSGGGATGIIVSPSYQGLSYCYVTPDGTAFMQYNTLLFYLNIFEVQANHTYILAVGPNSGTRRRATFFPGKTYSQFEPYIFESASPAKVIFSDGVWLAPYSQGTDDTGGSLIGRIIYTPSSNGVIVYFTDNAGANCPAYCIDMNASGGGTPSFDNILVGSSDPDDSIGTPGDMYIKTFVNRVDNHAYHQLLKVFYKSSQNVWSDAPDPTLPYGMSIIRIVTHSIGNNDASIDVYIDGLLYGNIPYGTVQRNNAHYFEDIYGIFIGYSTADSPDHIWREGWCIYPPSGSYVMLDGKMITNPTLIREWRYANSVDFTFLV